MNRRQFFKTIATTCTGVAAAVVGLPVVREKKRTGWENDVGGKWPPGSIQIDKMRDFGTCGICNLHKLIIERRKVAQRELGDIMERTWWAVSK